MGWFFFIFLNAAFFIRPADLIQSADMPIYNILMIACLVSSGARVLRTISTASDLPITSCVLGVVAACVFSHLSHGNLGEAVADGFYMIKIVPYYLLLIALVDTPARLHSFLRWLVGFTLVLTALALLHYHGIVQIEALDACQQNDVNPETGEAYVIPRLCSTGVFNDPNDLSMILVLAMIACLFLVEQAPSGFGKYLPLAPLGVFLYGLQLTYSRGGLLNFGLGLLVLFRAKFGWKKTIGISLVLFPVLIAMFGGRMTRIDVGNSQDTSQARIQLWSQGFELFRESPLFGVGMNKYAERAGLVAHNSFVHTFAELGFFGGTLFAGAFYAAFSGVMRLGNKNVVIYDPLMAKLRPYILAMIGSYCAGMFSLSRSYTLTTYVLLGIAAAYLQIAEARTSVAGLRFDSHFVQRLFLVGVGCLLFLYLFVRSTVRWS
jgi:hypothetical protein